MVLPVIVEALSPQHVAGAVQDGLTDDGDPSVYGGMSLGEPADVDCQGHVVSDDVVTCLRIVVARCADGAGHEGPRVTANHNHQRGPACYVP